MENQKQKPIDYSRGPSYPGGYLTVKTGSWRTFRPVVDEDKCKMCDLCWIYCPDGCIKRGEKSVYIDYDYCKGCGICAKVCKFHTISMERE